MDSISHVPTHLAHATPRAVDGLAAVSFQLYPRPTGRSLLETRTHESLEGYRHHSFAPRIVPARRVYSHTILRKRIIARPNCLNPSESPYGHKRHDEPEDHQARPTEIANHVDRSLCRGRSFRTFQTIASNPFWIDDEEYANNDKENPKEAHTELFFLIIQ